MPPILEIPNDFQTKYIPLIREIRKHKGQIVCMQESLFPIMKDSSLWVDIVNANTRFPLWIPLKWRFYLTELRKRLGHFLYYWLIPILKLQKPYITKVSYVLRNGCSGMGDSDIQTYMCDKQKLIFLNNGVNPEKLKLYPVFREIPRFETKKIITLLVPSENQGGVDRDTREYIPLKKQIKNWLMVYAVLKEKYPDYTFYLKFHPDTQDYLELVDKFQRYNDKNSEFFIDRFYASHVIDEAEMIVGLPPSFSTLLYQASVQYPWKKILSVDIGNEMFGNYFEGYDNIKTIKDLNDL